MTTAEQTLADARLGVYALVRAHLTGDETAINSILSSDDADPPSLLAAALDILAGAVEASAHAEDVTTAEVLDSAVKATIRKASWNCTDGPS